MYIVIGVFVGLLILVEAGVCVVKEVEDTSYDNDDLVEYSAEAF